MSESEDSGEPPSKHLTTSGKRGKIDRISALPESVIVHILSFLPTLDSIRTRVLSRRWQYLWTGVPNLNFDFTDSRRSRERNRNLFDFFAFVDKTLVLCDGSVKSFCVKSNYEREDQLASSVDLWARFASRNGVEKFELDFHDSVCFWDEIYWLPQFLFTTSTFRELRFSGCLMKPKTTVTWNSLKKLSIGYVNLEDDLIQRILAGTPVLETLELHHFHCGEGLHIVNSNVKKLILRESLPHQRRLYLLEISAPNILSLEISGEFEECQLVDVESLVEATLFNLFLHPSVDYDTDDGMDDDLVMFKAQRLFDSLAHVKTLTLGTWAILGLTMLHTRYSSSPLIKCECLTIDTRLWMSHPLGISVLLRYFPLLQTLIFTKSLVYHRWDDVSALDNLEEELSVSPIPFRGLESLKTVKFFGFWNEGNPDFELVEILLKNARMLQKMIIHMDARDGNPNEMFKAAQKLLNFQRSFPSVQLLIYS